MLHLIVLCFILLHVFLPENNSVMSSCKTTPIKTSQDSTPTHSLHTPIDSPPYCLSSLPVGAPLVQLNTKVSPTNQILALSSCDKNMEKSVIKIQSLYRGHLCRRGKLLMKYKAAIKIQATW